VMIVRELMLILKTKDESKEVFVPGSPIMGSELTGCMGYNMEPLEDVRDIKEGISLTPY